MVCPFRCRLRVASGPLAGPDAWIGELTGAAVGLRDQVVIERRDGPRIRQRLRVVVDGQQRLALAVAAGVDERPVAGDDAVVSPRHAAGSRKGLDAVAVALAGDVDLRAAPD